MSSATLSPPVSMTTAELAARVGDIPLWRICLDPFPGTATEQDVLDLHAKTDRVFELIDGILVEKALGLAESFLAVVLSGYLTNWVAPRNLGAVLGADGMMRLAPGLIRIPDVSFAPWDRFPGRQIDLNTPIPDLYPDLAVEVLRVTNTRSEMAIKLRDYFGSGASLVWFVDPRARTVEVYTAPESSTLLHETDTLGGAPVLPGFTLPLRELFTELDPH
jgi:Uma2 family endonuclease